MNVGAVSTPANLMLLLGVPLGGHEYFLPLTSLLF